MWDDICNTQAYRDIYGRLSYEMCDTQYNFNRHEYEREVKFLFQDIKYNHYQLGNCYFEIPVSMNQTSVYNKLDYIEKHYPSLNDTQLLKIAKFLSKDIPVAEGQEITKKKLTPEEQFEELKNKIKKPIEIKRKKNWTNEHPNLFLCTFALMFIMCLAGALIIAVNVKGG